MTVVVDYTAIGPSDAPVLVMSGSLGTDRSVWGAQAEALADHYRVITYDLRGHGHSPVTAGPYDVADLGDDLLALLDRLEVENAFLCGLSIGGMASMWAAAHAPDAVDRLVVCCTTARFDLEARAAYRERGQTVREHGFAPIADAVLGRWLRPEFAEANPETAERLRGGLLATPREGYAACCEALATVDLRYDLTRIRAPTLVIAGADDMATPPEHGRLIADRVAGARLEVVADAAHLAPVEQAEAITGLIRGFLDE